MGGEVRGWVIRRASKGGKKELLMEGGGGGGGSQRDSEPERSVGIQGNCSFLRWEKLGHFEW